MSKNNIKPWMHLANEIAKLVHRVSGVCLCGICLQPLSGRTDRTPIQVKRCVCHYQVCTLCCIAWLGPEIKIEASDP